MSNHYRLPGRPPCRCAVCWPKPARDAWRQVQRATLDNVKRKVEVERTSEQARELAEWLAQDVH